MTLSSLRVWVLSAQADLPTAFQVLSECPVHPTASRRGDQRVPRPLLNIYIFFPTFLHPSLAGVFFYLSSAVNPIIYNLLSRRFRAAFRNVVSPSCKWCHPQHRPQGPPAQKVIFLTECHLVELTEDAGPQFPCQSSIHNTQLTPVPCVEEVP